MTIQTGVTSPLAPSPQRLLRGLRKEFANWYVLGPISWIALPSRCPPRSGIASIARRTIAVEIRGGYRAECRVDEFFSFVEVFVLRDYEVPHVDWASFNTIVDVGANVGAATLWFARKAPQAAIISVEPSRKVVPALRRNIHANRLDDRVQIVAAALADHTGTATLNEDGPSVFGTTAVSMSGTSEYVPAVSLQDLLEQHGLDEVDFLKLDCEGAEFDILHAADDRLLRRHRFIVGEYHAARRADVDGLLSRLEAARFRVSSTPDASLGLFQAVRT
jgi:FkbM family methyltransferase